MASLSEREPSNSSHCLYRPPETGVVVICSSVSRIGADIVRSES
jgi:hypothetical protein